MSSIHDANLLSVGVSAHSFCLLLVLFLIFVLVVVCCLATVSCSARAVSQALLHDACLQQVHWTDGPLCDGVLTTTTPTSTPSFCTSNASCPSTGLDQILSLMSTKMWANAQRNGRTAEHRWRPLFNAAKFG